MVSNSNHTDYAKECTVRASIRDALSLGPHWYYHLDNKKIHN
jgi:hypothetical protein